MASVFVKVKCSDRLPKHIDKLYITDKGLIKSNYFYSQCVEWFMEEIELPSEEDIINEETMKGTNERSIGFIEGANFILKKLKGESKL